jgi:16S rRNA (uracil1498-N3)-methyltransferase
MRRFLIDASCVREGFVILRDAAEIRHIKNVLRLKPETEVLLSDGSGREYYSKLIEYGDETGGAAITARFEILYTRESDTEPKTKVTLFQCLPKQNKMAQIIQKTVELGVYRIIPVRSERSVLNPVNADAKHARWRKIAEAACKQSGRGIVPDVAEYADLVDIPKMAADADLILLPYELERGVSIKTVLRSANNQCDFSHNNQNIALIIGPEGGFAESEIALLKKGGARVCTLGKTVLRTETAGPAALAMIFYELELDGNPSE